MTLDEYQEITGLSVAESSVGVVTAQLLRAQSLLETALGFTLDPDKVTQNLYTELGKSPNECSCSSVDTENLDPPDAVVGAYRIFPYNAADKYLHVDPFSAVHKVKLVNDGVTVKTFDTDEYRVQTGQGGVSKYIEIRCDWPTVIPNLRCDCWCEDCVQLAVDATWLWRDNSDTTRVPFDLKSVWAEMVTYYADKWNVKSETVGAHSYTKFDNERVEDRSASQAVLRRYAGPWGTAARVPIR